MGRTQLTGYRLARVAGVGNRAAQRHLDEALKDFVAHDHAALLQRVLDEAVNYGGALSAGMRTLGNEAFEVVTGYGPLDALWSSEQDLPTEALVSEQLRRIRPDVVLFQGTPPFSAAGLRELRASVPSIRVMLCHRGFPEDVESLGELDAVLAAAPSFVKLYREMGFPTHLVYHYFDESVLDRLAVPMGGLAERPIEFGFAGSSGIGQPAHSRRFWELEHLLQNVNLFAFLDEPTDAEMRSMGLGTSLVSSRANRIVRLAIRKVAAGRDGDFGRVSSLLESLPRWLPGTGYLESQIRVVRKHEKRRRMWHPEVKVPDYRLGDRFRRRVAGPRYGMSYYAALAETLVSWNAHVDAVVDEVANIRMFQGTGVASCLLTDGGSNLATLFEDGSEVVAYAGLEDCVEKAAFLVANPETALAIARKGQQRTLKQHSAAARAAEIDAIIQRLLQGGS